MKKEDISNYQRFEHIEPNPEKWPIAIFANLRKKFLGELVKDVLDYLIRFQKKIWIRLSQERYIWKNSG